MMWNAAPEECPQAEYTGIALEYGTQSLLKTLRALRAEQWLQRHPEQQAEHGVRLKQQMRDAFYTDTDAWKALVLAQAMDAARAGTAGLSAVRN
jgi:hypothetical protein